LVKGRCTIILGVFVSNIHKGKRSDPSVLPPLPVDDIVQPVEDEVADEDRDYREFQKELGVKI
jgi:hypothetical protein